MKAHGQRDARLDRMMSEGAREVLSSPNGRAFVWAVLAECIDAEGEEGPGRRAVGREVIDILRVAAWEDLQIMREEWEKPKAGTRAEAEEEGEEQ